MSGGRKAPALFYDLPLEAAGFRLVEEPKFLKENYYMIFEKVALPDDKSPDGRKADDK